MVSAETGEAWNLSVFARRFLDAAELEAAVDFCRALGLFERSDWLSTDSCRDSYLVGKRLLDCVLPPQKATGGCRQRSNPGVFATTLTAVRGTTQTERNATG